MGAPQHIRGAVEVLRPHARTSAHHISMPDNANIIESHGIVLRPENRETFVDGKPVSLTKTEFRLLHFLAIHAGTVHTRQQIIEAVQGADYPATDRSVDSQVMGLRKILGNHGCLIEAVRGVGYRFRDNRS
jgi:two-component system, OmpR family, alkaline phosphatase synthesis response regulator PhoP